MRALTINIVLLILIIALALFWFFKKERSDLKSGGTFVVVGDSEYRVEVADSPVLKAKGLSGRTELAKDEGMLFPFASSTRPSFWMKGMLISIDIIWIADGKVVGFEENVPLLSESGLERYQPEVAIDYVLEVNAGEVKRQGIEIGDKVQIR